MAAITIPKEISEKLGEALLEGERDAAVAATEAALATGVDPLAIIQEVIVPSLTEVGRQFEELEIFLPELMAAGEAGNACSHVIEEALVKGGGEMKVEGVVVLGTVKGDIHDIGKNLVAMMLEGAGFEVIDLGINTDAETYIAALKQQ